jgi:nucleotide-binding universal stress UspA family protein
LVLGARPTLHAASDRHVVVVCIDGFAAYLLDDPKAQRFVENFTGQWLQARDVGAAIVDETTERGADLLVVGLPYRKRFGGEFAIGRTVPYILQNAPCAVWVVRDPITEEST